MRLPAVSNRVRFGFAYLVVGVCGFSAVVGAAAVIKSGGDRPVHHAKKSAGCSSVTCAQVGDTVTYTLHGRVASVSEPQPGVICVQTASSTQGGQVCVAK